MNYYFLLEDEKYETIDTIINSSAKIDALIVIVDAEELDVEDRRQGVYAKIDLYKQQHSISEFGFDIKVIVCNCCFESWLLGNGEIYPKWKPDEIILQQRNIFCN